MMYASENRVINLKENKMTNLEYQFAPWVLPQGHVLPEDPKLRLTEENLMAAQEIFLSEGHNIRNFGEANLYMRRCYDERSPSELVRLGERKVGFWEEDAMRRTTKAMELFSKPYEGYDTAAIFHNIEGWDRTCLLVYPGSDSRVMEKFPGSEYMLHASHMNRDLVGDTLATRFERINQSLKEAGFPVR